MAQTIAFDARMDTRQYAKDLRRVEGRMNQAVAEALNTVGSFAHVQSIKNIKSRFHVRNAYTLRAVKSWPVTHIRSNGQFRDVEKMKFISGSWSPYMALQETGGTQKALKGAKSIPMPTSKGRPSESRPIPNRLRLGPSKADFGKEGDNPMKLFALPTGIYYRQGKALGRKHHGAQRRYNRMFGAMGPSAPTVKRKLIMIRTLGHKTQRVKARHWHSDAMKAWGTWAHLNTAFVQAAERLL